MENNFENINYRLKIIEERNQRVENNKAWETSWTRRFLLILFTYLAVAFYLRSINISSPWINAIVPAMAFLISTLTMPFFKKIWLKMKNNGK